MNDDEYREQGDYLAGLAEDAYYRKHPDEDHRGRWIGKDKVIVERSFEPINRRELKLDYDPRIDEDRDDNP